MSLRSRIVALIIALAFIGIGIAFMVVRIGEVIGWENASSGWWVIAIIVALILLVAYFVYLSVRNKLNS